MDKEKRKIERTAAAWSLVALAVAALVIFWVIQLSWNKGVSPAFHASHITYATAAWLTLGLYWAGRLLRGLVDREPQPPMVVLQNKPSDNLDA